MKPNEESAISMKATGFGNYDLPGLGVQQLGILFQVVFLYHENINAPYEWGFIVALN